LSAATGDIDQLAARVEQIDDKLHSVSSQLPKPKLKIAAE
jgi:hypothetical protein